MLKRFSVFFLLTLISVFSFVNKTEAATTLQKVRVNSTGLVGYWTMDGADMSNGVVLDKSTTGSNANLVSIATTTFYTEGKIGQAFNLDGVDDYVRIKEANTSMPSSLNFGTAPFAVTLWFKGPNNTAWNGGYLIGARRNGGWHLQRESSSSGFVRFSADNNVGCADQITSSTNIYDNNWHFVVGYRDCRGTFSAARGNCLSANPFSQKDLGRYFSSRSL